MKNILVVTIFLLFCSSAALSADLDIGTHANFYLPPEGGGNTLSTGIDATYRIDNYVSARGSVDNASYSANNIHYSLTSLTIDLIYHALGKNTLDPYIGAGVGYYEQKADLETTSSTGLNALAGILFHFQSFNAGIEVKYVVPDTHHMETGFYSVGGQLTGGLHITL